MKTCQKCNSERLVKNGFMKGSQRYKCNDCGFQFSKENPRGKSFQTKIMALVLYLSGVSMNQTGRILGITAQSVMRWIKEFYNKFKEQYKMDFSDVKAVEIDEMCSYIIKKNTKSGSGKYYVIIPKGLSAGFVAIVVQKP